MSVWGSKPFENDGAADYVSTLIEKLSKDVDDALASRGIVADDLLWLHAPLEILAIVGKNCGSTVLKLRKVEAWKEKVGEILRKDPHQELARERRPELMKTFKTLIKVASPE